MKGNIPAQSTRIL